MTVKTEDFLSDEFLKQFKSGDQFNKFLSSIQKRAIEQMLEGELDGHLGYEKHRKGQSDNNRNGYGKKNVKTNYGEMEIQVPRARDATFNPMLVPKRENMLEGLVSNKTISMHQLRQVLRLHGEGHGTKYISRVTGVARNTVKKYLLRFLALRLPLNVCGISTQSL